MSEPLRLPIKKLQIEHAGAARRLWYARVPAEHGVDDVLNPAYFGLCVEGMKALQVPDLIEVEPEDLSWSLTLTVLAVNPQTRRVVTRLKGGVENFAVSPAPEQKADGYDLRYIGTAAGWAVVRGEEVLDMGHRTATAALEKLNQIAPTQAAA